MSNEIAPPVSLYNSGKQCSYVNTYGKTKGKQCIKTGRWMLPTHPNEQYCCRHCGTVYARLQMQNHKQNGSMARSPLQYTTSIPHVASMEVKKEEEISPPPPPPPPIVDTETKDLPELYSPPSPLHVEKEDNVVNRKHKKKSLRDAIAHAWKQKKKKKKSRFMGLNLEPCYQK